MSLSDPAVQWAIGQGVLAVGAVVAGRHWDDGPWWKAFGVCVFAGAVANFTAFAVRM